MRAYDIHRTDRLQFPFPRAMLRVEIFAMADDNQRARRICSSSGAGHLRTACTRSRRGPTVTRPPLRDRLSKPSRTALNPFRIRRVQFCNRPSYGRPRTYRPTLPGRSEPIAKGGERTKKPAGRPLGSTRDAESAQRYIRKRQRRDAGTPPNGWRVCGMTAECNATAKATARATSRPAPFADGAKSRRPKSPWRKYKPPVDRKELLQWSSASFSEPVN